MAFGNASVHVKVYSITLESLTSVRVRYTIGISDVSNAVYNLQPANNDSFTIFLTLTPGNPIPGVQDFINAVENEIQTKFGGIADFIEVDGTVYPFPPPNP